MGHSNNDGAAWGVIESWMSTCISSHERCRGQVPQRSSYRPTRLLEILSPETFRLVESTSCPSPPKYVALSYCWGQSSPKSQLRLLKGTESFLRQEQQVLSLPKTFRDAIEVALHFGVRHLWIDRLCIFQDSVKDWQQEASTMKDVYRNAVFGIAALSAQDADSGLFFHRQPEKVTPPTLNFKPGSRDQLAVCHIRIMHDKMFLAEALAKEPLMQRSWIVQELVLAPRVLYFGSTWNFWSCRQGQDLEPCADYRGWTRSVESQGFISLKSLLARAARGLLLTDLHRGAQRLVTGQEALVWNELLAHPIRETIPMDPYKAVLVAWDDIVEYFAARQLSFASDKLVAISGLAKDVSEALHRVRPGPHRYLAGLWEETIISSLLWRAGHPCHRPATYRAPSWSWASIDGPVGFRGGRDHVKQSLIYASSITASIEHVTDDEFGEVKRSNLTLKVPVAAVSFELQPSRHALERRCFSVVQIAGREDWPRAQTQYVEFDTQKDQVTEACLALVCISDHTNGPSLCEGLILASLAGNSYHRLGVLRLYFSGRKEAEGLKTLFVDRQINIV